MALLDYSRLDEKINLRPVDSLASFQNDVIGFSQNFMNNTQLATPPFANVRLFCYKTSLLRVKTVIFTVPHLFQPVETLAKFNSKDETGKEIKIQFDHGTTTLGFRYKVSKLIRLILFKEPANSTYKCRLIRVKSA